MSSLIVHHNPQVTPPLQNLFYTWMYLLVDESHYGITPVDTRR